MSSDVLTQLQTCYDQLLTQLFSTVSYLSQRHPMVAPQPIPGDKWTLPPKDDVTTRPGNEDLVEPYSLQPASPDRFEDAKRELAEDLVRKGQQIEHLIEKLPGLGKGEEQQKEDIRQLLNQVREMESLLRQKQQELKTKIRQLDAVVMGMANSINVPQMNGIKQSRILRG